MSFERSRVSAADWVVAGGAVALFAILFFLHWYGGSITGLPHGSHISGGTVDATGWEAFTSSRWVWLVTIAIALGSLLAAAASYRLEGPVQIGAVVFGMGALSSVLILYRIVHHPGESVHGHGLRIDYGIEVGIWLGLLAALAIVLGGYLQLLGEASEQPATSAAERPAEPAEGDAPAAFSGLAVAEPKAPPSERAG